jgi:hypothetical protein
LDARIAMIVAGETPPGSSHHGLYAALEAVKAIALALMPQSCCAAPPHQRWSCHEAADALTIAHIERRRLPAFMHVRRSTAPRIDLRQTLNRRDMLECRPQRLMMLMGRPPAPPGAERLGLARRSVLDGTAR